MSATRTIACVLYGINALVSVVLGSIYLFTRRFMPYHQEAVGMQWEQVDPSMQVLITALMDVAGAGWLALGVAVAVLIWWPFRNGERWSRFLVPALLLLFYLPTLLATLMVLWHTPATPPWYGNAIALGTTGIAFVLDRYGTL